MRWGKNQAEKITELTDLVCYAETDKAMLLGIPDCDDDADPPQKAWFPLSQVWGDYKITGHTADLTKSERTFKILCIKIKTWILDAKYKDGHSTDPKTRKGGLEDKIFDDYITGEGSETAEDLEEIQRR